MKLIVGLGNIGEEYAKTNHNAGFIVVDALAEKCGFSFKKRGCDADYAEYNAESNADKKKEYLSQHGFSFIRLVNLQ